ncbi:MAG: pilus assembly protein CpaE, partial [Planctomycetota bacterium]
DMLAMDLADDVLMVTQLDLPCLRNVVRLMMSFETRDGLRNKCRIVVNRVGQGGSSISIKKAEATLGQDVFWQLPNDYKTMIEVRNNGVPLVQQAPKAPLTQSIAQMARELTGAATEGADSAEGAAKTRGWLGLFGGKKGAAEEPAPAEG